MGGESKSSTQTSSQTDPWDQATPALKGILSQLQSGLGQTGLTGNETNAINSAINNAGSASQFTPQIMNVVNGLFNGGGANGQAPFLQAAYDALKSQTSPLASNTNYDPYSTPGFRNAIDTMTSDITSGINSQFAAAGRDFSGANQQALARGISQGIAPTIAAQYNQNVQNQQNAADRLYSAGNQTGGLLSGLNQQAVQNQQAGAQLAPAVAESANAGNNAVLQAEAARRGIPVQALGLLAQIGIPIAGLGSQSNGTSTTTNQMSGAQQFATITGGLGNLFGGGGGTTAGNMTKFFLG